MTDDLKEYKNVMAFEQNPGGCMSIVQDWVLAAQKGSTKSGSTWDVFGTPRRRDMFIVESGFSSDQVRN
jgi:hypothetical protein